MRIKTDEKLGVFVFSPQIHAERRFLESVIALKPGSRLEYDGRSASSKADVGSPYSERMTLSFKPSAKKKFSLTASSNASEKILRLIRDACYMAHGLYFLDHSLVGGRLTVRFHLGLCKHCKRSVVNYHGASSNVCDACAAKCSHKSGHLGLKDRCRKCHRAIAKP